MLRIKLIDGKYTNNLLALYPYMFGPALTKASVEVGKAGVLNRNLFYYFYSVMRNHLPSKPVKSELPVISFGIVCILVILEACHPGNKMESYKGTPYSDSVYNSGPQSIPGKLQCEYFDFGGEGVAFHDSDSINSGSGKLNPADGSYLHEFRINEAVDISFTKFRDPAIDNSPYNLTEPGKDQLYVGWTAPGEWTKYTVNVEKPGIYELGLMYTSNQTGKISVSVNNEDKTGPLTIPTTFVQADTVMWRQWHHWNYIEGLTRMELKKGLQTITLHTVDIGQMNYDFIDLRLIK